MANISKERCPRSWLKVALSGGVAGVSTHPAVVRAKQSIARNRKKPGAQSVLILLRWRHRQAVQAALQELKLI